MRIDWTPAQTRDFPCPVCRSPGSKRSVLAVDSPFPEQGTLRLYACGTCGAQSFPDVTAPPYEVSAPGIPGRPATQAAVKFYVEQGAAPDTMVDPLFWFDRTAVRRYAEVGCGFGFALDFAEKALGWQVCGYDPSPLARAGRQDLGVPITTDYLGPNSLLGVDPYDVILASEVIEHIANPHEFLNDISPAVAEAGILVISTPNAAGVRPSASLGALLPLLTPGYHLVLFTEESLRRLLLAHGFAHVHIRASDTNLTTLASRRPFGYDPAGTLDRRLYRDYLERRLGNLSPDQYLAHGLAGRLIKERLNAGDYREALSALSALTESYRRVYSFDFDQPDSLLTDPPETTDFDQFAAALPMNLCGLAYRRAFIAIHHEGNPRNALAYFELGERAGRPLRRALQSINCDDGETEHLVWLCRLGALEAAACFDPAAARARLSAALGSMQQTGDRESFSRPQFAVAIEGLFVDLTLRGDYEAAMVFADVGQDADIDLPPRAGQDALNRTKSCYARGLLALNRSGDSARALRWFQTARTHLEAGPVPVGANNQDLSRAIETALLYAQAVAEPTNAARTCLERLSATQSSDAHFMAVCIEVFLRLVNTGAYEAAAMLAPDVEKGLTRDPSAISADLALSLGILSLNHNADPVQASAWFSRAAGLAPQGSRLAGLAEDHQQLAERAIGARRDLNDPTQS